MPLVLYPMRIFLRLESENQSVHKNFRGYLGGQNIIILLEFGKDTCILVKGSVGSLMNISSQNLTFPFQQKNGISI